MNNTDEQTPQHYKLVQRTYITL